MTLCEHVHPRLQHGRRQRTASGEQSSLALVFSGLQPFASPANPRSSTSTCTPAAQASTLAKPPAVVPPTVSRLLRQSCSSPPKPCQTDQLSADRLPARLRLAIDNATFSTRHPCMPPSNQAKAVACICSCTRTLLPPLDNGHTQAYIHIYMHACDNMSPPQMLRTPSKRALAKYYDLVC